MGNLLLCDANMKSRMGAAIGQRLRVQKKVFAFFMKIGRIRTKKKPKKSFIESRVIRD